MVLHQSKERRNSFASSAIWDRSCVSSSSSPGSSSSDVSVEHSVWFCVTIFPFPGESRIGMQGMSQNTHALHSEEVYWFEAVSHLTADTAKSARETLLVGLNTAWIVGWKSKGP